MEPTNLLILFAGGLLAGVINVMAGGAGFMTFPLLIAAGMTEMEANACNFVALLPANLVGAVVYRRELRDRCSLRYHSWCGRRCLCAVVACRVLR